MPVELELETVAGESRIAVRFRYSEETVASLRRIPGCTWNKKLRLWNAPLDWGVCRTFRLEFGDKLAIGPALLRWAAKERGRQAFLKRQYNAPQDAQPVPLPVVESEAPTIYRDMLSRGYQTLVPAFCRDVGSYFNSSEPGTGKTIETQGSLIERRVGHRVLVIAPTKALHATWLVQNEQRLAPDMPISQLVADREHGSMADRDALIAEYHGRTRRTSSNRFDFLMIHPEMLSWAFECPTKGCNGQRKKCPTRSEHTKRPLYPALFKIAWHAVVMDETHRFMMHANTRASSVSGWGYGAQKLKAAPGILKIGMSGTPFKGKPRSFWNILHWLDSKKYSSQYAWTQTYFEMDASFNPFARNARPTDKMRADREALFKEDMDRIMIRHTKAELRLLNPTWAPPEKIHVPVILPMEGKQMKAYEEMVADAMARLDGGILLANGLLAERTRLKQLASSYGRMERPKSSDADARFLPSLPSNKWEWILEALEERGLEPKRGVVPALNCGNGKVVIASRFTSLLDVLEEDLRKKGISYFIIRGSTRNTPEIQAAWQSNQNDTRVLLLSTDAAGYSIDLDAADDMFVIDEPENPDDQENLEDRIHRTGRTDHQVTIYHIISADSIDVGIAERNLTLDEAQKRILDGRRAVPYSRKVLEERDVAMDRSSHHRRDGARHLRPRPRPRPARQGA